MNTNDTTTTEARHPFERAGLGIAPFRAVAVERRVGPIKLSNGHEVGYPGQPMGTCQFCGQGIAEVWTVRGSDGRTFEVGCDCVRKCAQEGGRVEGTELVERAARKLAKAAKAERDARRFAAARELLALDAVRAALEAKPHPTGRAGATAFDYVEWCLRNAGTAGKTTVARMIEAAAKAQA